MKFIIIFFIFILMILFNVKNFTKDDTDNMNSIINPYNNIISNEVNITNLLLTFYEKDTIRACEDINIKILKENTTIEVPIKANEVSLIANDLLNININLTEVKKDNKIISMIYDERNSGGWFEIENIPLERG